MRRGKTWLTSVLSGLAALVLAAGLAQAHHVTVDLKPWTPAPTRALVVPQTLQVDEIKADQVRAHTIYANRIDADQVQGLIYQIGGLENRFGHGEIRAPEVSASVIYADTISANSVVADAVYVRDLRIQ